MEILLDLATEQDREDFLSNPTEIIVTAKRMICTVINTYQYMENEQTLAQA